MGFNYPTSLKERCSENCVIVIYVIICCTRISISFSKLVLVIISFKSLNLKINCESILLKAFYNIYRLTNRYLQRIYITRRRDSNPPSSYKVNSPNLSPLCLQYTALPACLAEQARSSWESQMFVRKRGGCPFYH